MRCCHRQLSSRPSGLARPTRARLLVCAKASSRDAATQKRRDALKTKLSSILDDGKQRLAQASAAAGAVACAAALLLSSPGATLAETASTNTTAPAAAAQQPRIVRLPASSDPGIFAAQAAMVEAWQIAGEQFVDADMHHTDWPDELRRHMAAAYAARDPAAAYGEISALLSDLGDPYTRIVPADEYAAFRVSSDGELQGVGLLIANEPDAEHHLRVLAPIKGSPAERAGVKPGDAVLAIDNTPTDGFTGEQAAALLRGKGGTEVRVRFARRTNGIPGVPGRPEPQPRVQVHDVRLRRATVSLSPVYHTALRVVGAGSAAPPQVGVSSRAPSAQVGGRSGGSAGNGLLGYVRLSSFSSNAAAEMAAAIKDLEHRGARGYILDLRSNPGGLVKAGIDVARLWLDGAPTLFSITGRADDALQQVSLPPPPRGAPLGGALTRAPLVVLVDGGSASASEIVTGALRDAGRATVVGDEKTYGKGKIQSVYELHDGSALFLTVARYVTPAGQEIDTKGITPQAACTTPGGGGGGLGGRHALAVVAGVGDAGSGAVELLRGGGDAAASGAASVRELDGAVEGDACVMTAARMLLLDQQHGGVDEAGAAAHVASAPRA